MSPPPLDCPVLEGSGACEALVHVPAQPLHVPAALASARESLRTRIMYFVRTLMVGFWANLVDFALLAACVRWLHIEALPSRCIALVLSGVLTFIGSRTFVFRMQGSAVPQQAGRFILAELAALVLNLASFELCALCAPHVAPEIVSFVANAFVFVGFSYPVRRLLVFTAR